MGKVLIFTKAYKGVSKMKTPTVLDVANYFLKIVDREAGSSITHLKLQKLVYYAQAWHAVFTGKKLFNSRIEAWVHGPVCPELYNVYAGSGYDSLPAPKCELFEFNKEQLETLEAVWECYGGFDGKYLEELTHQESPWIEARRGYAPGQHCNNEISIESMIEYYSKYQTNGEEN